MKRTHDCFENFLPTKSKENAVSTVVFPINLDSEGEPVEGSSITIRIQIPSLRLQLIGCGVSNSNGVAWISFQLDLPLHQKLSGIYTIQVVKNMNGVIETANETGLLSIYVNGEYIHILDEVFLTL